MFKNLKLSAKIAFGFGTLILIAGVLGLVGWYGLSSMAQISNIRDQADNAYIQMCKCGDHRRDFGLKGYEKDAQGKTAPELWNESYNNFNKELKELAAHKGLDKSMKGMVDSCIGAMDEYKSAFESVIKAKNMRDEAYAKWGIAGNSIAGQIQDIKTKTVYPAMDAAQKANDLNGYGKWAKINDEIGEKISGPLWALRFSSRNLVATIDEVSWVAYQTKLKAARDAYASWASLVKDERSLDETRSNLENLFSDYTAGGEDFRKGMIAKQEADKQAFAVATKIFETIAKLRSDLVVKGYEQTAQTNFIMITMALSGIVLGIILAMIITRSIIKPINQIISGLTEGAEQVSSASNQVSSASQSLAEGATEQAAGLEETSSSLEEMASMTKQNAENAQQAAGLSNSLKNSTASGAESMKKMNDAINQIQKSSDETAKIIKVIDEIAFQTNLLALNAAVEAARAGEAGKGFAVVAEEVRNLAMRSAEAAKNTSAMIEDSVKNSKNGVEITNEVAKVLHEVGTGVSKTADLVNEIAAASQEQAKGIDQVNVAVAQMDKVTQSNAANAEESASASEELNAQALNMNEMINELVVLVGGAYAGRNTHKSTGKKVDKKKLALTDHTFHNIIEKGDNKQQKAQKAEAHASAAKKRIPFDNDQDNINEFNS